MSYPVFLDLNNKLVVIIGGGRIATRKLKSVMNENPQVLIIAGNMTDEIIQISEKHNNVLLIKEDILSVADQKLKFPVGLLRSIQTCLGNKVYLKPSEIINEASLVFLATPNETETDQTLNKEISTYCSENNILLNNSTNTYLSSFSNGARLQKHGVDISIGTGGNRPGVSKWLKQEISGILPADLLEIIEAYDLLRIDAKSRFNESADREAYIKEAFGKIIRSTKGNYNEN